MTFKEALIAIEEADVTWTVLDFKACIFADDLRDGDLYEAIAEQVFHNYSLIKDALNRLGLTTDDLQAEAFRMWAMWPESYCHEDGEFAVWDAADGFVMDVLARDSRICKRAGW
jgi:hypothetical protein